MTTIRHGGPSGLRIGMRLDERGSKTVVFRVTGCDPACNTFRGGGCYKIRRFGVTTLYSPISLIPLWLSSVNRPTPCRTGEKEGDESDPPQSGGGHVTPIAVLSYIPLSGPMRGRSRPHLSLREGSEPAPQEGR